jgi:hypothetical protein
MINRSDFVLERRVNQPLGAVQPALVHPALSTPTNVPLGPGTFRLHDRFGLHPSPMSSRHDAYQATGELRSGRGRLVAGVELELSPWNAEACHLELRPLSMHPEWWRGRRLRSYFALAHVAADRIAGSLQAQPEPTALVRDFAGDSEWSRVA